MLAHRTTYTVADLLTAYEVDYLPLKAPTTQYQQARLFVWLRQELGFMLLTDLTPTFLRQWRDLLGKRYAPGTVRRYLASLSGPLSAAVLDYEWLTSHPLRKVRKPPGTPHRTRFLSEAERSRLLAACKISRNPHLHTIVLLALTTGARKQQVRALRWRDVDLARGTIRLQPSKGARHRTVPVVGEALTLLADRCRGQAPDAWVFARHDGLQPIYVDVAFVRACKRAGIDDFRFHDLRHTTASYLAMSGASPREIMEVLGHTNITQAMEYSHLSPGHTSGVLQRMAETFLGGVLFGCTLTTLGSVWLAQG